MSEQLRLAFIQWRALRGVGVRELSRRSGIAPSTIVSIEKGRRSLSLDHAVTLFESMGLKLEITVKESA